MSTELAHLDGMEDSLRQVAGAERTHAVAMAQQETVAMAQVLKVCSFM